MKRAAVLILIYFFLYCPASGAETVALTLDEAVFLALRQNHDVLLKAEDVAKAKLKIAEARAGLFPTLTFTGAWTETMKLYSKDVSSFTTQTSARQYLYTGGKVANSIKYNEYSTQVAEALLDKTKHDTVFSVQNAFYTLLLGREYASLNRKIVLNTEEHFKHISQRYRMGQASESDIIVMKASLSSVRQAYIASLNDVETLNAQLCQLLFLKPEIRLKLSGKLTYELKDLIYDVALLKAVKDRPEIRQYDALAKANLKAVQVAKAGNRPSVYASWDYYSRSTSSLSFSPSKAWQDYSIAGITVSWPVFDGWATKAKVEQAIVDLRTARLLKEQAVEDITAELKTAYLSYRDAIEKVNAVESQIDVYMDQRAVSQEKYFQGQASSLDLDDAILSYDVSIFSRMQAVYDYVISRYQFDKARGEVL
ncbi:MAG: TolC family protein [Candidatus Omnitrophica bacterium]|nr:TolC family protein [Candidatus Omnitrophota bacterium]